eukprot:217230-Amphidinium_carterae.1
MCIRDSLWRLSSDAQKLAAEGPAPHQKSRCVGGNVDIAAEVHAKTVHEAAKGWLQGPFRFDQVSDYVGRCWTPSRRFGVCQSGKVRCIDNMSEFMVNAAFGYEDKLDLNGIDEVVGLGKAYSAALTGGESLEVALSTGEVLRGTLHPDFQLEHRLRGRCLGLQSAYKQLPLRPQDRSAAVLLDDSPSEDCIQWWIANALPFGSTGAVVGFNRVARALRALLTQLLGCTVSNYFDDFPQVDVHDLADDSRRCAVCAEELLQILGFAVALGDKAVEPSERFTALGVVVDLTAAGSGKISICNKPGRVESLCEQFESILQSGFLDPTIAGVLLGRM